MYIYYFYFYSVVAGIAIIVHLCINWQQLVMRRSDGQRGNPVEFRHYLISLLMFFISDLAWGILIENKCRRLAYIDTTVFFLTMALSVQAWARYVAAYLELTGKLRSCLIWAGRGLFALTVVLMAINPFTDCFFRIDETCQYSEGPMRQFLLALLVAFNAAISCSTFFTLLLKGSAIRRRNVMVFAVGLTLILAISLQFGHPLLPIYSLGSLFGCCLIHVFVFEDERDELHQKEILARDYETRLVAERTANRAKSLFFSSVSHDIRTPLNAILGFSELLEQGVSDESERKRFISSIRSSGKVLARLVDDILDLSKLESGKLEIIEEPTDVPALVHEVVAACEIATAHKSLVLKSEVDKIPVVSLDPHRVRQILFNLLSNACKYTEHGTITVNVHWHDGTLSFSVVDTGVGISEENIANILQPFVQVVDRNNRNGTGLGLPICNKLAKLMGGELTIESKVGVGSKFTVTLRDVKTVDIAPHVAKVGNDEHFVNFDSPSHTPSRVLVVDDSSVNRMVLKALLSKCGIADVGMAENGREALELLKKDPNYDMVLSDLWMPEMDGYALIGAIRSDDALSRLPVYLITADVDARNQAESSGFNGILLKPVSLKRLKPLIEQIG